MFLKVSPKLLIFALLFIPIVVLGQTKQQINWKVKDLRISLETPGHVSEGVLLSSKKKLIHIFRFADSIGHVSNTGAVAKRESLDQGMSWSEPTIIYQDKYDCKNISVLP